MKLVDVVKALVCFEEPSDKQLEATIYLLVDCLSKVRTIKRVKAHVDSVVDYETAPP